MQSEETTERLSKIRRRLFSAAANESRAAEPLSSSHREMTGENITVDSKTLAQLSSSALAAQIQRQEGRELARQHEALEQLETPAENRNRQDR